MSNTPGQEDIIGSATLAIISGAKKFNSWMYEEIKPQLHGRVLEIGSGTGNISNLVLQDKFETVLSDYNPFYLDQLKKTFAGYANLQAVLQLDLQAPSFEKENDSLHESFDTIFLLNVIEHLQDDYRAVAYCKYMLKPGGRLILLAPACNYLYCDLDKNLGHYRRYTVHSLANLLKENQLAIMEKKYFNLAGMAGWFIWGKLFRKQQLDPGSMGIFNSMVPISRLADRLICRSLGLSAIATGKKI